MCNQICVSNGYVDYENESCFFLREKLIDLCFLNG